MLGIDRDEQALAAAGKRLERFGDRVSTAHSRFDGIREVMRDHDVEELSGALFDLGVSSPQLDMASRGFSYRNEGPIDMRMDRTQPWSAADVVNGYEEGELARIIRRYGDERFASASPRRSWRPARSRPRPSSSGIVAAAIPAAARRTGGHPAKRTFQAIRIEVNSELDVLPDALDQAIDATVPTGRIAVLTYHSGEDRIVKDRFRVAERSVRLPSRSAVRVRRGANGAPNPGTPHADGRPGRRQPACPVGSASRRREGRLQRRGHDMSAMPMRRIDAPRRRSTRGGAPIRSLAPTPAARVATATATWPRPSPSSSSGRRCTSCPAVASPPTPRHWSSS